MPPGRESEAVEPYIVELVGFKIEFEDEGVYPDWLELCLFVLLENVIVGTDNPVGKDTVPENMPPVNLI